MFLNDLQEGNKELFLKVCVHASLANDIFEEEEKEMIYAYCREMNIIERIPEITDDFDAVVSDLASQTDDVEKKIIVLGILGLVKSDGLYDEKEKVFVEKLVKGLQVEDEVVSKLNSLLESYTAVCKEIYATVRE